MASSGASSFLAGPITSTRTRRPSLADFLLEWRLRDLRRDDSGDTILNCSTGPASLHLRQHGNLATDGTTTFTYDIENKLTSVISGGVTKTLAYDPLNRLDSYVAGTGHRFIYDGAEAVAEINDAGTIVRRFVRGDGTDEILLEYSDATTNSPRYHHLDERGSDITWSDAAGAMAAISTYDEYGTPKSSNPGQFQYTGRMWLPELGVYNDKARIYSPTLGRFLQTDPIGYDDGPNWYAYANNDPVNGSDPLGLQTCPTVGGEIVCTAPNSGNEPSVRFMDGRGSIGVSPNTLGGFIGTAPFHLNWDFNAAFGKLGPAAGLFHLAGANSDCPPHLISPCGIYRPISPEALEHIAASHFGPLTPKKSIFATHFQNEASLTHLYIFATQVAVPVPDRFTPGVFNLTAVYATPVGWEKGSGNLTYLYTFRLYQQGTDPIGMPIYVPTNAYPGVP